MKFRLGNLRLPLMWSIKIFRRLRIDCNLDEELSAVYEEIMWLAARPNVTPSVARSWYTHATVERLKKKVRMFTGRVSERAAKFEEDLRLEHFLRIQTTLTQLVERHLKEGSRDAQEFIDTIKRCEQVHIVTRSENYAAMKAKGCYQDADIKLVDWSSLGYDTQLKLWKKMLRGKVANHSEYQPLRNS